MYRSTIATLLLALTLLSSPAWAAIGAAEAMNLSGMQRMLSQRIAKLYLAMSWRLPVAGLEETFAQATCEFDLALQEPQQSSQNTTEIAAGLKRTEAQWRFTRAGFDLSADSRYVPTVVTTTTETLLWQMHDLTQAYENLMAEG